MAQNRTAKNRYVLLMLILLPVLLGLIGLYYLLTRPPVLKIQKELKGYSHVLSIYGYEGDRLHKPVEVAVDKNENIYVTNTYKHNIVVFDKNGRFIEKFGKKGRNRYELWYPNAIAVDNRGFVWVGCKARGAVIIYDLMRRPVWEIEIPDVLAIRIRDERVYVTTSRGVMIGDLRGNQLAAFGTRGRGRGQLDHPTGIVVDSKGNIYVADSMNYRVQAFNKEGKFLWSVGEPVDPMNPIRTKERKFGLPVSLAIDENEFLYLMDAFNGEIYVFNKNGKQQKVVGSWGYDDGQFYYPAGITYVGSQIFAVADKFNDRVQLIYIPSPAPQPAIPPLFRLSPLLLLLLLLPLLFLRRRRVLYVAEDGFMTAIVENQMIPEAKEAFKSLLVRPEAHEAFANIEQENILLGELLIKKEPKEKIVENIIEKLNPERPLAETLALAKARRMGKVITLLENEEKRKVAEELGLRSVTYDEFKKAVESREREIRNEQ